jgi:hypothetical protein
MIARYERMGGEDSVQRVKEYSEEVLRLLPDGCAARYLAYRCLVRTHLRTPSTADQLRSAIHYALLMVDEDAENMQGRLTDAIGLLLDLRKHLTTVAVIENEDIKQDLLRVYLSTWRMLPRKAVFALDVRTSLRSLSDYETVSSNTAALALLRHRPDIALNCLAGRTIFWRQAQHLRANLNAEGLTTFSHFLERESYRNIEAEDETLPGNMQEANTPMRRQSARLEQLVSSVHKEPGFDRFFDTPSISELSQVAHSGSVVALIAGKDCCHAVIIKGPGIGAIHIPLPGMRVNHLHEIGLQIKLEHGSFRSNLNQNMRNKRTIRKALPEHMRPWQRILAELWRSIVKPVLDRLCFQVSQSRQYYHI